LIFLKNNILPFSIPPVSLLFIIFYIFKLRGKSKLSPLNKNL